MTTPASNQPPAGLDTVLADAPYRIAAVTLVVRDRDALTRFYRDALGLGVVSAAGDVVRLGTGVATPFTLRQDPNARSREPREAGLFHTPFLMPRRGDPGAGLVGVTSSRGFGSNPRPAAAAMVSMPIRRVGPRTGALSGTSSRIRMFAVADHVSTSMKRRLTQRHSGRSTDQRIVSVGIVGPCHLKSCQSQVPRRVM